MPGKPPPEDVPACQRCGEPHLTPTGRQACLGHVVYDRSTYVKGDPSARKRLDKPRGCRKHPVASGVCEMHGVNADALAAKAERQVADAARKLIPDLAERAQITNPLETLLELASEANAFRESLRVMANDLDGKIRYSATGGTGEQLRAEVATYRQALKDTTDLLVAIARLDIEKMLARVTVRQAEQTLESLAAGCDDAGLDAETKRKVIAGVGRHLRLVRRPAA